MATLINVCGTARSGSTMLDLMLGNSQKAFSCGEVVAWFRPYRTHHFEINCPCQESACPIWQTLKNVPAKRFHATVAKELDVDFVIDSSKDLGWILDSHHWAASKGLAIVNLVLWKEPVDLAYSYWKRGKGLMAWRRVFVNYYSKLLRLNLPFQAINYNELASNPAEKLEEICARLDMPYFAGKERFWTKQHHHLFGSWGIRRQVEAGQSKFMAKRPFSPDFEVQLPQLKGHIKSDTQVQKIINTLKQADISSSPINNITRQNNQLPAIRPLWYYVRRTRGLYLRYFPYQFDPAQHITVETIPRSHNTTSS